MNKWVKIGIGIVAVGFGLILLLVGGLFAASSSKMNATMTDIPTHPVTVASDPETLARGKHLYESLAGCIDCHGADGSGNVIIPGGPMGHIEAANITSGKGSVLSRYKDDAELARAIRHGVRPDGSLIRFMPTFDYIQLSNQEIGDMISYVRSLPPVDKEHPQPSFGPLGRVLLLAGASPILVPAYATDHKTPIVENGPPPGATAEYGKYRASGCTGCHRHDLNGGPIPGADPSWPPARNITMHASGMGSWTEQDFFNALRTGKRPDGTEIKAPMPIGATKLMTDDEIRALWLHIQTVPPAETGK